jgi:hypothetical protein
MIFVWGKKMYVYPEIDQGELEGIIAPCLKPNCMGQGRCKLYRVERWCTIYFCIPLCELERTAVVRCERCHTMWSKELYMRDIQTDRQRAMRAALVAAPAVNEISRIATTTEEGGQEGIPLVAAQPLSSGSNVASGGYSDSVVAGAVAVNDESEFDFVGVQLASVSVNDESEFDFVGVKPTSA